MIARVGSAAKFVLPPLVALVVLLTALEVGVRVSGVNMALLPPPSRIVEAGIEFRGLLWRGTLTTAAAALAGFGLSAVLGIAIGVVLSSSRWIERAFYPYAVFFQTVPIIAIAPLLVVTLGAGFRAAAVSAFIVSIFPVIANTLAGLLGTDPALRDMFRLYGAGPVSTLAKLRLPSATPSIVTGLRIAAGLAVIGTIVGEFVSGTTQGSPSLGQIVLVAINRFKTDLVFATILAASVLGLALFGAVNLLGWLLLRHWDVAELRR